MTHNESAADAALRIARLARLSIDAEEARALGEQFTAILTHFESLAQLDVEGVEPMTRPEEITDVLRDDAPRESLPVDEALANAPEREDDFYRVPKTVGGDS